MSADEIKSRLDHQDRTARRFRLILTVLGIIGPGAIIATIWSAKHWMNDQNDGRYVKKEEHFEIHRVLDEKFDSVKGWTLKHGDAIQELQQFKAGAVQQLNNIERSVTRIENKLDGPKGG